MGVCTTDNKLVTLRRTLKEHSTKHDEIMNTIHEEMTCFEMLTLFAAGAGDFYCSGNDLTNFTKIPEGGVEEMARKGGDLLR